MATLTAVEQRQIDHYVERVKAAEKETHVDNSSLYAGSPMYYYCRECGVSSLPHFRRATLARLLACVTDARS